MIESLRPFGVPYTETRVEGYYIYILPSVAIKAGEMFMSSPCAAEQYRSLGSLVDHV